MKIHENLRLSRRKHWCCWAKPSRTLILIHRLPNRTPIDRSASPWTCFSRHCSIAWQWGHHPERQLILELRGQQSRQKFCPLMWCSRHVHFRLQLRSNQQILFKMFLPNLPLFLAKRPKSYQDWRICPCSQFSRPHKHQGHRDDWKSFQEKDCFHCWQCRRTLTNSGNQVFYPFLKLTSLWQCFPPWLHDFSRHGKHGKCRLDVCSSTRSLIQQPTMPKFYLLLHFLLHSVEVFPNY